ncbi:MAG: hypothetical protein AAF127_06060 [Pseudomonadota bacterium]
MSLTDEWARCIATMKHNAPEFPIEGQTGFQNGMQSANRVAGFCTTLLDGLDRGLHGSTATWLGIVTSSDTAGRVEALNDAAISWAANTVFGAANAVPVAGLVALLRGGYQSLSRSRQIIAYSNQLVGYCSTFAASAVATANQPGRTAIVLRKGPQPTGQAALPTNLPYFRDGCAAAGAIIMKFNRYGVASNTARPGALLFGGLGTQYRQRHRLEDFLYRNILLGRRKDEVLEELRQWAR